MTFPRRTSHSLVTCLTSPRDCPASPVSSCPTALHPRSPPGSPALWTVLLPVSERTSCVVSPDPHTLNPVSWTATLYQPGPVARQMSPKQCPSSFPPPQPHRSVDRVDQVPPKPDSSASWCPPSPLRHAGAAGCSRLRSPAGLPLGLCGRGPLSWCYSLCPNAAARPLAWGAPMRPPVSPDPPCLRRPRSDNRLCVRLGPRLYRCLAVFITQAPQQTGSRSSPGQAASLPELCLPLRPCSPDHRARTDIPAHSPRRDHVLVQPHP